MIEMTLPPAQVSPTVLILAAGLGTRMKSDMAKVLHRIAGRPLLFWPMLLSRSIACRRTVVVMGHQLEAARVALTARFGADSFVIAHQERLCGTGDAVRTALTALKDESDDVPIVILYGDVPLLSRETVSSLIAKRGGSDLALVATRPPVPNGYGRLVRSASGHLERIVEERDATAEERAIGEVNAGIYAARLGFLRESIQGLSMKNAQGELYLTDLVQHAARAGVVPTVEAPFEEVSGVNDRVDLARLDALARSRIACAWMQKGVTILAPETVHIDADIELIGRDTTLGPGVHLRGATRIGARASIDVGCILTDTQVEDGVTIKPYSVLTGAHVGPDAQVGPFSHCRPGTELGPGVHLGNFVETKKAHLSKGAKANHLSYLGDAEIGVGVNVGAGTITCNYDGTHKYKTIIEDGAFIGSDTQLVAPVTVGKGAYVGAGTTVTEDVPAGALALTRTEQKNVLGYVDRKAKKAK